MTHFVGGLFLIWLSWMAVVRIDGYQLLSWRRPYVRKLVTISALKPGVTEKIEQIQKEYYELLEKHPEIATELKKDELTDEDFSKFSEDTGSLEMYLQKQQMEEDIPDKLEPGQSPLTRAKVMKSILDCQQALYDIESDLLMCREKIGDNVATTRSIASNFEKDFLELQLGMEEELNKLIEE